MSDKRSDKLKEKIALLLFIALALAAFLAAPLQAQPSALDNYSNTTIPTPAINPGALLNTTGGAITNLTINATTQNFRWKGFVGRISGALALEDSSSRAIYDWSLPTITGEIYATRNSSIPIWASIACASNESIASEQATLNISTTSLDSINLTFQTYTHSTFYVGTVAVSANSCRAIALNVNNTQQSTDFQEVLLTDGSKLIYASILENATYGFDANRYDFQMIVADNALEGQQPSTAYYLYVELV